MSKAKNLALHYQIIIALILGVVWALVSASMGWSSFTANWIAPFGDIFIKLLKLIAVPLVFFSIIQGITSLSDTHSLGRLGLKTIIVYIVTTFTAITVGLGFVNVIRPGEWISQDQLITNRISYELWVNKTVGVDFFDQTRLNKDPQYLNYLDNAVAKLSEMESNEMINDKVDISNKEDGSPLAFLVDIIPGNVFSSFSDSKMLQIIFFAIFFGVVAVNLPNDRVDIVIRFIHGSNDIFIKMVDMVMQIAPYFVFALMAGKVSELAGDSINSVFQIFKALASYSLTLLIGLAFLVFVLYPLVVRLITNIGYKDFFQSLGPAQLLAFSTSSSAATLPVTMECVSDKMGVKEEVSSFVLPIGATVNMDGTSLYQGVAVVFLAQFHMIDLSLAQQLTIILTATLASIGSAAIPSAGLIMMIVVLQSVGLNPAWIAIIFPVDRFLDMCRTVVNVTGDASVAAIIAKSEGKLKRPEKK